MINVSETAAAKINELLAEEQKAGSGQAKSGGSAKGGDKSKGGGDKKKEQKK